MRYPPLVPPAVCHTKIKVYLEDGINPDGSPRRVTIYDGMCNYSEHMRQVLDADRRLCTLSAVALIPGDMSPDSEQLSGSVLIGDGQTVRTIHSASRARNPDGTVNYTRLDLM